MSRWSAGLLQVLFAFVICFLAEIVSISVSAFFHSRSSLLFGITFLPAAICLFLFAERAFPSVYSELHRPRPWWQTRAARLPVIVVFALIVSILSSRMAALWFGLLLISGLLLALLVRATKRDGESLDLIGKTAPGLENHFQVANYQDPQSRLRSSRNKQVDDPSRPKRMWRKPPFSIAENYALDVRNIGASRDWYAEKLGFREANDREEDDSGRPFADLHIGNDDTFVSLIELPPGASAGDQHVIFFAKDLEKAHRWLAARGVLVEPITSDSGGNRLFRFHDLQGNKIEVCVEPG